MSNFSIFSVLGIEIEYMLVDKTNLNIRPLSDLLLKQLAGHQTNEVELGDIAISNELVMHVVELKTNGPKTPDAPINKQFHQTILDLQPLLAKHDLLLLPTGAHPWMDPHKETIRWPHDDNAIYNQYDKIFDCRGHGWANLQSMHVNLPYANDDEFCRLHNLIRLLIPLIPALAASTPILDGKATGILDSRLYFYENNQKKLPSISGLIIPEFIKHTEEYQQTILDPMYLEIGPHDPEGILQYPWLNSRGAIPKFDMQAIEIRIIDSQECPDADLAIAKAIHEILKFWDQSSDNYLKNPIDTAALKTVYDASCREGLSAPITNTTLLAQWQIQPQANMTLHKVWECLIDKISHQLNKTEIRCLEHILSHGNLSERILNATRGNMNHDSLFRVYSQLSHCLLANEPLATP